MLACLAAMPCRSMDHTMLCVCNDAQSFTLKQLSPGLTASTSEKPAATAARPAAARPGGWMADSSSVACLHVHPRCRHPWQQGFVQGQNSGFSLNAPCWDVPRAVKPLFFPRRIFFLSVRNLFAVVHASATTEYHRIYRLQTAGKRREGKKT